MYYQVFKKGQRNLVIFYSNWKWKYDMINLNPLSWIHTRVPYKWSNKYNFVQFKTYFYAHVQYICFNSVFKWIPPYLNSTYSTDAGYRAWPWIYGHCLIRIIIIIIIQVVIRLHILPIIPFFSSYQSQIEATAILRLQIEAWATTTQFSMRYDSYSIS